MSIIILMKEDRDEKTLLKELLKELLKDIAERHC